MPQVILPIFRVYRGSMVRDFPGDELSVIKPLRTSKQEFEFSYDYTLAVSVDLGFIPILDVPDNADHFFFLLWRQK